jgi:hypothetical protein
MSTEDTKVDWDVAQDVVLAISNEDVTKIIVCLTHRSYSITIYRSAVE